MMKKMKKYIPPTRQGDNNDKRLDILDKICEAVHKRVKETKESDDNTDYDDEY